MPYCCAHTRGGGIEHRGRSKMTPLCTRTPTPPPVGGGVRAQGGGTSNRATSRGQQGGTKHTPVLPRPPFGGTSEHRAVCMDRAKRHQTVHARPPTAPPVGGARPSYKAACTVGQKQRHAASEGWGDATDAMFVRLLQDKHWSRYGDISQIRPGMTLPGVTWRVHCQTTMLFVSLYNHVHCRQPCKT